MSNIVHVDLAAKKQQLPNGDFFNLLKSPLPEETLECLRFLYAYMPAADIVGMSGQYFVDNTNIALQAREELPWGRTIPERDFKHFVLPIRVNNENLDDFRTSQYNELKERVKGLSMKDAVIEINHWCNEHATFKITDARTTSPLNTMKAASGRCGEESTFTVAALRSVCIPARQVYTPRWAHTDDNHAWVEAWVDGTWYFFGACEPQPVLNLGWFNSPASQAMLIFTRVFGRYDGPEEVMHQTMLHTTINVTNTYATTALVNVTVFDASGSPASGALVQFKVYNYGEFFTCAEKQTTADGRASLRAGLGSLLVWVVKDGYYSFQCCALKGDQNVSLSLNKRVDEMIDEAFDHFPPPAHVNIPEVTQAQREENEKRCAMNGAKRTQYETTFMNTNAAEKFAATYQLGMPVVPYLVASKGNHVVLKEYFIWAKENNLLPVALDLVKELTSKDLGDVPLDVLVDHTIPYPDDTYDETFAKYVRCPRVSTEWLTPYRSTFQKLLSEKECAVFRANPLQLENWVKKHISVDQDINIGACPMTPVGVWNSRVADTASRDIFIVSLARAIGIPSQIHPVTGKPQLFLSGNEAHDVSFEQLDNTPSAQRGLLVIDYIPERPFTDPKYYTNFSFSEQLPDGTLRLLKFDEGEVDMGSGIAWSSFPKSGTPLSPGKYVMITGVRLSNGGVLGTIKSFFIDSGKTTAVSLRLRSSGEEESVVVIGNFDAENTFQSIDSEKQPSLISVTGRGFYIVAILGVGQEPTKRVLADICTSREELEEWGRKLVFLFPSRTDAEKFHAQDFPGLPSTIVYGIDTDNRIQKAITKALLLRDDASLPLVIVADTFNRIVFMSEGYTINIGNQLQRVIHNL